MKGELKKALKIYALGYVVFTTVYCGILFFAHFVFNYTDKPWYIWVSVLAIAWAMGVWSQMKFTRWNKARLARPPKVHKIYNEDHPDWR